MVTNLYYIDPEKLNIEEGTRGVHKDSQGGENLVDFVGELRMGQDMNGRGNRRRDRVERENLGTEGHWRDSMKI